MSRRQATRPTTQLSSSSCHPPLSSSSLAAIPPPPMDSRNSTATYQPMARLAPIPCSCPVSLAPAASGCFAPSTWSSPAARRLTSTTSNPRICNSRPFARRSPRNSDPPAHLGRRRATRGAAAVDGAVGGGCAAANSSPWRSVAAVDAIACSLSCPMGRCAASPRPAWRRDAAGAGSADAAASSTGSDRRWPWRWDCNNRHRLAMPIAWARRASLALASAAAAGAAGWRSKRPTS